MKQDIVSFIITGITREGRKFRPSDWAERLCGVMSVFGTDNRTTYSPYVRPGCNLHGDRIVVVDRRLYEFEPQAYRFLSSFASDNRLQIEKLPPTPEKNKTKTL